jgi:hypothetical protein
MMKCPFCSVMALVEQFANDASDGIPDAETLHGGAFNHGPSLPPVDVPKLSASISVLTALQQATGEVMELVRSTTAALDRINRSAPGAAVNSFLQPNVADSGTRGHDLVVHRLRRLREEGDSIEAHANRLKLYFGGIDGIDTTPLIVANELFEQTMTTAKAVVHSWFSSLETVAATAVGDVRQRVIALRTVRDRDGTRDFASLRSLLDQMELEGSKIISMVRAESSRVEEKMKELHEELTLLDPLDFRNDTLRIELQATTQKINDLVALRTQSTGLNARLVTQAAKLRRDVELVQGSKHVEKSHGSRPSPAYRFVAVDNLFNSESHLFTDAATSAATRARTTRPDDLLQERSRSDSKKRHRAEIDVDDATNFGDENAVDDAIRNGNGGVRVPLSPLEELERQFMFS